MNNPDENVEYYVVAVVRMEDEIIHTAELPRCLDRSCPCWQDWTITEQENRTMLQFGTIIFEHEDYVELLLAEHENGTRCILCVQYGVIKLYRIEWLDELDKTYWRNEARYDLLSAIAAYKDRTDA